MTTHKRKLRLCSTGKFSYLDEGSAMAALDEAASIPREWHSKGRPPVRCYLHDCGFYHLTSSRREPRK